VIGLTQVMAKELGRYSITTMPFVRDISDAHVGRSFPVALESFPRLAQLNPREIFENRVKSVTPLRRSQEPKDIANLVAFLASEEARNITGQSINVDGGALMQ
jgi:NAD(P)-dependent dehydrogenase (short-subunit alcohol dehydrogenase family)